MHPVVPPNPSLLPLDRHAQTDWDAVVVGGGLVGLCTAYALRLTNPSARILLLEKESSVASHQSSRNSGVIHSGLIYPEESLKAKLCLRGKQTLLHFCQNQGIQTRQFGKIFTAMTRPEIAVLKRLEQRAQKHQIFARYVSGRALRDIEPNVSAMAALHVPSVRCVDFAQVARSLAGKLIENHVHVSLGERIVSLKTHRGLAQIKTQRRVMTSKRMINCAGVYADRLARKSGLALKGQIVPFKGIYYHLRKERRNLINGLIYPAPKPNLPFLGIHLTRTVHEEVHCGPNAVLAMGKSAYRRGEIVLPDLLRMALFPGLYRMLHRHKQMVRQEFKRSTSARYFLQGVQNLVPAVQEEDVVQGFTGIRAQAMLNDGTLVNDFWFESNGPFFHVLNAPSPAATASFAIGEAIAKKVGALL